MINISKIEFLLTQKKYHLIINMLNSLEIKNELVYYFIAKSYFYLEDYQNYYENLLKALEINPYGFYKNEIFSFLINEISLSGKVKTNRKKIVIDSYDKFSSHARAIYPFADCITIDEINNFDEKELDYFIIPNWLAPNHPIYNKIDELNIPVISMIVDRVIHSEEHIKPNLIYSDLIVCMENYSINLYKKQGFEHVIYIPCAGSVAYDPYIYPPIVKEKIYDLIFLGNISSPYSNLVYKKRKKILDKLDSLKNKYNILIQATPNYNEYVNLISQAKICLDSTIDTGALNFRMFQAMGMGTLLFAEDDNSMVKELYEDKKDLVLYNLDNLDELINLYSSNKKLNEIISSNGKKKTLENYTHYHLMKRVIDAADKLDLKKSQKHKIINTEKFYLYKAITYYYKKDYSKALELFSELDLNQEIVNNIFVQKLNLYQKNNLLLEDEINNIFKTNRTNILVKINYFLFLFFIKNIFDKNLLDNLNKELAFDYDYTGLIFESDNDDFKYLYKYYLGEVIFNYGLNSLDYNKKFYLAIKRVLNSFRF
ncbi:MAG: glycosyltransferase [Candidatus Sericytochromatia bacterium]